MCALAGIVMLMRFNSVREGEGEALLLVTVLALLPRRCRSVRRIRARRAGVRFAADPATLSSGLNLLGANEHLATAVWGLFLIAVMVLRFATPALRSMFDSVRK